MYDMYDMIVRIELQWTRRIFICHKRYLVERVIDKFGLLSVYVYKYDVGAKK